MTTAKTKKFQPIRVRPLAGAARGYRVLASWQYPEKFRAKHTVDAWIPALAPSHILRRWLAAGVISWSEFSRRYRRELGSPSSQDLLKPIALLSRRRAVVLLCDCRGAGRCPAQILSQALEDCRQKGSFVLTGAGLFAEEARR
ncbi:MAG: DUF488 family protein [Elusimicrobia bacterium]|nr:DUF488 family protein [Elusimicrobiota bacterium]